jgi:antitoxin component of MazEF toxin-antitoxin module
MFPPGRLFADSHGLTVFTADDGRGQKGLAAGYPVSEGQMTDIRFHVASTTIVKWGHGLGLRIPLTLARKVGLEAGTHVDILRQGRRIILEPRLAAPTLEGLLAGVRPGKVPGEAEWRRRPGDPDRSRPS